MAALRQVSVQRVLTSDVNSDQTSYRYQKAFIWEKYKSSLEAYNAEKDRWLAAERSYEEKLGFGFLAKEFSEEKRCAVASLPPGLLPALVELQKVYNGADLVTAMALPQWDACIAALSADEAANTVLVNGGTGCFMRIEETSAKEFECYVTAASTTGTAAEWREQPCAKPTGIFARPGDIPFKQRRTFKAEIVDNKPVPEVPEARLSALSYHGGIGPYTNWHVVLSAAVVDDKCQVYAQKHADRGTALSFYAVPWDPEMDREREFRVYVHCGFVVAISPWNHCGKEDGNGGRVAFPWVEALSDAELEQIGHRIVDYVESGIVKRVVKATGVASMTVDVLLSESNSLRLVELGPYGAFLGAGSTLFHWLETDALPVEEITAAPTSVPFRVLTDDAARGAALSVSKPIPKPDM